MRLFKNWLYVSDDVGVYRYPLKKGELAPQRRARNGGRGFPRERQHADKTFALDPKGTLYVNVGAPSNSCQEKDRQEGSLGLNPCPILEKYGGVWVFDGNKLNQTPANGRRFATGMRNAVAIEWNARQNALYSVIHGRDSHRHAVPRALHRRGQRHAPGRGIPPDHRRRQLRLAVHVLRHEARTSACVAPEYGGDGKKEPEAGKYPGSAGGVPGALGA